MGIILISFCKTPGAQAEPAGGQTGGTTGGKGSDEQVTDVELEEVK